MSLDNHRFLVSKVSIPSPETLSVENTKYLVHRETRKVPFEITFHPNDDDGYWTDIVKTYDVGDAYGTFPEIDRHGYLLLGWNYLSDETGDYLEEMDKVSYYQLDVYAHWLQNVYIEFDASTNPPGGSWWYDDGEEHFYFPGMPYGVLPMCQPDNSTYEFIGWFTSPEGEEQITEDSIVGSDSTVLYAQYQEIPQDFNKTFRNGTGYWEHCDGTWGENFSLSAWFDTDYYIEQTNITMNLDHYPDDINGYSEYEEGVTPASLQIPFDGSPQYLTVYFEITNNTGAGNPSYGNLYFDTRGWCDNSNDSGESYIYLIEWYNENTQSWDTIDITSVQPYPGYFDNYQWNYASLLPYISYYNDGAGNSYWGLEVYDETTYDYRYVPLYTTGGIGPLDIAGKWRVTFYITTSTSGTNIYLGCFYPNLYGDF